MSSAWLAWAPGGPAEAVVGSGRARPHGLQERVAALLPALAGLVFVLETGIT